MAQLTADCCPMCPDTAKACYAKWQNLAAFLLQNLWRGDFRSLLPYPLPSVRTHWNVMTLFSFEQPFSPCECAVERQNQSGCRSVCLPATVCPLIPTATHSAFRVKNQSRQTEPVSSCCSLLLESKIIWKCLLVVRATEGTEEEALGDSKMSLRRLE